MRKTTTSCACKCKQPSLLHSKAPHKLPTPASLERRCHHCTLGWCSYLKAVPSDLASPFQSATQCTSAHYKLPSTTGGDNSLQTVSDYVMKFQRGRDKLHQSWVLKGTTPSWKAPPLPRFIHQSWFCLCSVWVSIHQTEYSRQVNMWSVICCTFSCFTEANSMLNPPRSNSLFMPLLTYQPLTGGTMHSTIPSGS